MSHDNLQERQAFLYAVGSICKEEVKRQKEKNTRHCPEPSKETLAIMADLLYTQTEILATELQFFAHHANRKVIKQEDVILCARKCPSLAKQLQKFQQQIVVSNPKRRKLRGGSGAQDEDTLDPY